ncbi:unnamed protein product [Blumeria hordei]|uniref:Candidate secreted effector protein n=1 Tax=Blumeria hordei TaxID=2867405 RepID=A0A383USN2_BLUHO|nr:unnamed protein product [Blumeria hordei]
MKLLSMTAVALLVEFSVSIHLSEDDGAFINEPKLPVLDSNFGMDCYSDKTYGQITVKTAAAEAYTNTRNSPGQMERCTFDRFPMENLFLHPIGGGYVSHLGVPAQHYIIINSAGQFLAGMLKYETHGNLVSALCRFTPYTVFLSYAESRRLNTQGDRNYYGSQYGQAGQQPPIGSNRRSHSGY